MKPALPLLCTALLILCAVGLAVQQHVQHTAQLAAITALFERIPQMTIQAHDAWKHEQSERESRLAAWKLQWDKEEREAAALAAALKRIPAHVTDPALRERAAKERVKIEREALRHP